MPGIGRKWPRGARTACTGDRRAEHPVRHRRRGQLIEQPFLAARRTLVELTHELGRPHSGREPFADDIRARAVDQLAQSVRRPPCRTNEAVIIPRARRAFLLRCAGK